MTNFKHTLTPDYEKYKKPAIERRRAWAMALLGGKCARCGSQHNLEFDHIKPESVEFRIGSNLLANKKRLEAELRKCQLLCHSCHVIKTRGESQARWRQHRGGSELPPHGTITRYSNRRYGCRCNVCKKVWASYYAAYQRKRRAKVKTGSREI